MSGLLEKGEMKFKAPLKSFATKSFNKEALYSAWSKQTWTNAAAHIWFAVYATENQTGASVMKKSFKVVKKPQMI